MSTTTPSIRPEPPDTTWIRAQFDAKNVPLVLRERKQWVVWRYEWDARKRKWTKVPFRVGRRRRASCSNSAHWSAFDEAVQAWLASDDLDGIMFVFTPADSFCGIDLDDCRDANGHIATGAHKIIDECASYTEISPSTEGAKLFIVGKKPEFAGCRSTRVQGFREIEIYDRDRFFVVTGARLPGTPPTVEERQEPLNALCAELWPPQPASPPVNSRRALPLDLDDNALLEKIRNSKHGPKFQLLWDGDTSAYGGDHSRADLALCGILAFWTGGDAPWINQLFRQSKLMRPKWDERRRKSTYGERTIAKALRGKTEFYSSRVVGKRAKGANPNDRDLERRAELRSDIGIAARLVLQHGRLIRFCHPTSTWYIWSGTHWQADHRGQIVKLCKTTALSLLNEAKRIKDDEQRKVFMTWARQCQGRDRLNALAELAKPDVAVTADELDRNRFLFNCRNGTIDLRKCTLRPHDPADLITHVAPVKFDPDATCPLYDRFMAETFCGDTELIQFIDQWLGHCLTGDVTEQYFIIGIGAGNNGKNVLLDTISGLMGPYAAEAPPALLTLKKHAEHPTEIADLMGRRLVVASETERDEELRVQLVKRLTGNARLKGRFMRADFVEFDRTHKLVLLTNNVPHISEDSDAVWRRVVVVPFDHIVPEEKRDKHLLTKLAKERAGILARLVRGCLSWQKNGLCIPSAVTLATTKLRGETNSLLAFLRDCCDFDPLAKVVTADLKAAYHEYCNERRMRAVDARYMADALRQDDCEDRKHSGKWHWFGVALKASSGHGGHLGRSWSIDPQNQSLKGVNGQTTSTVSSMSSKPTLEGDVA
jgi:putative DNA primase/helicase